MKKTPYILANGLLDEGNLASARSYLEERSQEERRTYPFVRSWCELLWLETDIDELRHFSTGIAKDSVDLRALHTLNRTRICWATAEHKKAIELAEEFFQSSELPDDRHLLPEIRMCLGNCWLRLRNIESATTAYERALEEFQQLDDNLGIAVSLSNIAMCRRVGQDWNASVSLYTQSILVYKSHGQTLRSFAPTLNRGSIHLFRGRFSTAREDIEAAVRIATGYARHESLTSALAAVGLLELRSGSFPASAKALSSGLRLARSLRLVRPTGLLYEYIGELRFREGNYRSARVWLNRAINLAQTRGLRDIEHEARGRLAEVELREGNLDLAEALAREALDNFQSMNDQYEIAVCQRILGQILLTQGRSDLAERRFVEAEEFFGSVGEVYERKKIERLRSGELRLRQQPERTEPTPAPSGTPEAKSTRRNRKKATFHPLFPELLTASPTFLRCLDEVAHIASSETSVLILGASGTGKEAVARGLHRLSQRSDKEFVAFNCAMSNPGVFDAEFYGHLKGAFTDAQRERTGLARTADGGTLFLDEIAELSAELQARILRFLDTGEIRPVGSDSAEHVDVRIIAATHQNLDELDRDGGFRHDLRFRLSEVAVKLPTLNQRPEDIPILVDHYLNEARRKRLGNTQTVAQSVIDLMRTYAWPGNVRELRNEVFGIVKSNPDLAEATFWKRPTTGRAPQRTARDELIAALEKSDGNVSAAGRLLGVNRINLYRLMEKYEIRLEDYRPQ